MNNSDRIQIARIRQAQQARITRQSWDYLDLNHPLYPELIVQKANDERAGRLVSVSEAMRRIKSSSNQKES